MCGIVLAGGNMYGGDVDLFEKLLYHDIERGKDSTGVMVYRGGATEIHKNALPADLFLRMPGDKESGRKSWSEFRNKLVEVNSTTKATAVQYGSVYVGHNRAATAGKVCDENAHPFQHGHITLVHNGTLRNQALLPDSDRFAVDSDNISYSIATIGVDETIQKLHGAFTLIWIDSSDETLHIIRNSERPFHLLEKTCGDWFGASEEDMLMWVLRRQKSFSASTIKRHFECKVGTEYVFKITGKKMTLQEEREHTLPVFRTVYNNYSGYNSRYDSEWDDYYSNPSRSQTTQTSGTSASKTTGQASVTKIDYTRPGINKFLRESGYTFQVDNQIPFWFSDWKEYSARSQYGCIRGYGYEGAKYYAVTAHNVPKAFFESLGDTEEVTLFGTIRSASTVKGDVTLAVTGVQFQQGLVNEMGCSQQKHLPAISTNPSGSPKSGSELKEMYDGQYITYDSWANRAQKQSYKCPICNGYHMWSDVGECVINDEGLLVHFDCQRWSGYHDNDLDDNSSSSNTNRVAEQFKTARMLDGSTITFEQFQRQMEVQGGTCPFCDDPIEWDDIECCTYYSDGRTIVHDGCENLDQYDKETAERINALTAASKDEPNDEFVCDICKDFLPLKEIDSEASVALKTDVCKTCAKAHKLNMQTKGVFVKTNSEQKVLIHFTEEEVKKFIKAMGSDHVTWNEIDFPDVEVEKLGKSQYRYYRRPKQSQVKASVTELSKQLSNGMKVTKVLWQRINTCFQCHRMVPWKDAETVVFAPKTGKVYCEKCAKKVGIK